MLTTYLPDPILTQPGQAALPAGLASGEQAMPHAPLVDLPNGRACIPQHYLQYRQTQASLADILGQISLDANMPLFAAADAGGLYLQVGIIGRENYERGDKLRAKKLVYGRKWRIETYTPTSEIVQTALLAFKKAREHELREHLTLRDEASGKTSAPLSSHLDLPLMARNSDWVMMNAPTEPANPAGAARTDAEQIRTMLAGLRFGQRGLELLEVERRRNGCYLLDLRLGMAPPTRQLEATLDLAEGRAALDAEHDGLELSLTLEGLSRSELMFELMDALIRHSDRWVEENFRYAGFARFSRGLDPLRMAQLSIATRPYARDLNDAVFSPVFRRINEQVDAARVPSLGSDALAGRNRRLLDRCGPLEGYLPQGYVAPDPVLPEPMLMSVMQAFAARP